MRGVGGRGIAGRAGLAALLVIWACRPEDYNLDSTTLDGEVILDQDDPMRQLQVVACSSEAHLVVQVGLDLEMDVGAITGLTLEQGERVATGFAVEQEGQTELVVSMIEVECEVPIEVTIERLDADLLGTVVAHVRVVGDAEGYDGSINLEVVP